MPEAMTPNFMIQKLVLFTEVRETDVSVICFTGLQDIGWILGWGRSTGTSSGPVTSELRPLPFSW